MEIASYALVATAAIALAVTGAIYANHRILAIVIFGIAFLFTDIAICLFWAAKTEPPEHRADAVSGVLAPKAEILFTPNNDPPAQFDVCDAGPLFIWAGPKGEPFFDIFNGTKLTVERVNGSIAVSTSLKDASGRMLAEIVRNEWRVRPSLLWDKNFSKDSLEIRDESGDVVLQVSAARDFVRIRGKWRDKGGQFLEITEHPNRDGVFITFWDDNRVIPIKPLFLYPSDRHLGELSQKDWRLNPLPNRHTVTIKTTIRMPNNERDKPLGSN